MQLRCWQVNTGIFGLNMYSLFAPDYLLCLNTTSLSINIYPEYIRTELVTYPIDTSLELAQKNIVRIHG